MTLIDNLIAAYSEVMAMLSVYPVAQAAVAASMGILVTSAVGFVLYKTPMTVWHSIQGQCFTKLVFNTQGTSEWDTRQARQFNALLNWFSKSKWIKLSRSFTFNYVEGELVKGPGPGTHYFFRKWRLFKLIISEKAVQGTTATKYEVTIQMLGRSQKTLYAMMEDFMVKEKDNPDTISLYTSKGTEWDWVGRVVKRGKETVILPKEVEDKLFHPIEEFHRDPTWYRSRGINYKLTYLLYGEPGTGKSSIARVLASMYNRPVYTLDLEYCKSFLSVIQRARGGILLIEDIDTFDAAITRSSQAVSLDGESEAPTVKNKGDVKPEAEENAPTLMDELRRWGSASLSSLLNALDGVAGMDDVIIIMTTNHPEKLDPALIRDGRVDVRVEIPRLEHDEICRYIKLFFPDYKIPSDIQFQSLPGATVQQQFMLNKRDPEKFISGLQSARPVTQKFRIAS